MKRIFLILLAVLLTATLFAACDNTSKTGSSADGDGNNGNGGNSNTLIMATNAAFEPYEYYGENGEIIGIDAEIGKAIADKLNMEFEITDIDFDAIITAVQSGKATMGMAGMTVTPDREKNVNFTRSYATGIQSIIVPEDSDIASVEDLEGKKIGVQQGTTGDIYCSDTPENGGFGEDAITRYNKGSEAVMALLADKVDCVVIDNEPAKAFVKANEGLKVLDTYYAEEEYAIAIAKDNTEMYEKIDNALGELIADGTVQNIIDKYITAD